MKVRAATYNDLKELLSVQKEAFIQEAERYNDFTIHPLIESLQEVENDFKDVNSFYFIIEENNKIIGGVRTKVDSEICSIYKLVIKPEFQKQGFGKILMEKVESAITNVNKFVLFTGEKSEDNIAFYKKLGYKTIKKEKYQDDIHMVFMEKNRILMNN